MIQSDICCEVVLDFDLEGKQCIWGNTSVEI